MNCQAGLPAEWPGASLVKALLEDTPIEGLWFDRTKEYSARRRKEDFSRLQYATPESLILLPLPCWDGIAATDRRQHVARMIDEVVAQGRARRGPRAPRRRSRARVGVRKLAGLGAEPIALCGPQGFIPGLAA